jgi:hypothetical protein
MRLKKCILYGRIFFLLAGSSSSIFITPGRTDLIVSEVKSVQHWV